MSRLGIHTLTVAPDWSPEAAERILPRLRECGVTLVEIPLLDPGGFDAVGARRAAERHGVAVACSLGLPDWLDVTRDTDSAVEFLDQVFRSARDAGSDCVTGVTYGTIGRTSGHPPRPAEIDAICRLVERAAATAASLGMTLGIEPCNRYETHLLNTARQAVEIIERVGADNVFVHLDTYHMNIEERSFGEGFEDAGEHLGYVHLSEANRGVPGAGNIAWDAVFGSLAAVDFDGTLTFESFVHIAPELAAGIAIWRPVAERPDDVLDVGIPFLLSKAADAGLEVET